MTSIMPTEAERIEKAQTIALTERQIEAACTMWRDPHNWRLTPTPVGKRNLYMRIAHERVRHFS
jgi:hypothetical protein